MKDPAEYERWYKKTPAPAEAIEQSVYGLTEWNAEAIKDAAINRKSWMLPDGGIAFLITAIKRKLNRRKSILLLMRKVAYLAQETSLAQMTHFSETNENTAIYKIHQAPTYSGN